MNNKGLLAFILRQGQDCSNKGISSRADQVIIIGEGIPQIFEASETAPAVRLMKRGDRIIAVPVNQPEGMLGPMMGGTFIYTSDSRFPAGYPIALHDRFETQAQYDALSI